MTDAFFIRDGSRFVATESTRGPWSSEHAHGGPPAALIGREIVRCAGDPDLQVVRITFDLRKPVPIGALEVSAEAAGGGKSARWFAASLAAEGEEIVRATALCLRRADVALPDLPRQAPPPGPDTVAPYVFPFFDEAVGYHTAMEVRIARGTFGAGPTASWMRMRIPLVAGEDPSPLERVLVAADSGNGVSPVLDTGRYTFVNPDLTVHLHRLPAGEWVCLDARTTPEPTGLGLADTRLWDREGPLGRSAQSLLVRTR